MEIAQKRNINRLRRGVVTENDINDYAMDETARDAFQRSLQQNFHTVWTVQAAYRIQDGRLYSGGEPIKTYPPMGHHELPGEMAKLRPGDEASVLQFAQTYGVFGYAALHHPAPEDVQPEGEPLDWLWAHARGIKMCMDLSAYLQTRDEARLDAYLDTYRAPQSWRGLPTYEADIASMDTIVPQRWVRSAGESAVDVARYIRMDLMNRNIRGIHREFQDVEGRDQSHFVFSALVEVAYWQLAEMITTSQHIQRCEECGAPFVQSDPRQRFCPPREGQNEGVCAIRSRVRKHRERARQKA